MLIQEGSTIDVHIPAAAVGSGVECNKGVAEKTIGSTPYLLLPLVGNGINYTESMGKDVLSGPFTGCIMAIYKRNGSRRVCHVATPECKDAWAKVKGETEVIKEFKPSDHLPDSIATQLKSGLVILGYVTADDKCYAFFARKGRQALPSRSSRRSRSDPAASVGKGRVGTSFCSHRDRVLVLKDEYGGPECFHRQWWAR